MFGLIYNWIRWWQERKQAQEAAQRFLDTFSPYPPPPTFKYRQLRSDEFRLLYLLPPDNKSATIKCRIRHTRLRSPPKYQALSYAWSYEVDSEPRTVRQGNTQYMIFAEDGYGPQNILVNGHNFTITNNLYFALKRLRAGLKKPRTLWIDQICINQKDVDERSSQVLHMRRIYTQAEVVVIWLGKQDKFSEVAMPFLPVFTDALEQEDLALSEAGLQAHLKDEYFHAQVTTLHFLLDRPWWHRVWVIQEVALAKQAVVCCGSDFYLYDDFERLFHAVLDGRVRSLLGRDGIPQETLGILFLLLDSCTGGASLSQLKLEQSRGQRVALSTALKHTSNFLATDPRDKVFALLGLTSENLMRPDYRLTTLQVYSSAMTCMLKEDGDLRAFCWLGDVDDQDPDWPSWVRDFTKFKAGASFSHRFEWKDSKRLYSASGTIEGNPLAFTVREEGKVLVLRGIRVDVIAELGDESPEPSEILTRQDNTPSLGDILPSWKRVAGLLDSEVEDSRLEAFWRTVLADQGAQDFDLNGDQVHSDLAPTRLPKVAPSLPPSEDLEKAIIDALDHGPGPQYCRRLFTTEGARMGIAPRLARRGDIVCVLVGGEVPYVLRPGSEGYYEMLGEW
jgi:hypothetical protein